MMKEEPDWYKFQESICDYFNSIGAIAETNVTLHGVRTNHDIDVLVKTKFLGEDLVWIIEAKKWKSRVNKFQVLALRTIVDDTGVDRGFIISEAGFQSGAIEAAENSNVKLKTFEELKIDTRELVESEVLKMYRKRLKLLETRYWSHDKEIRIKYGLRNELCDYPISFSGNFLLQVALRAILKASQKKYPIKFKTFYEEHKGEAVAENFQQLTNWLNLNLNHFDEKLLKAEVEMMKNGDFDPYIDLEDDQTFLDLLEKNMNEIHANK